MQSMGSGRMDSGFGSDISISNNSGGYGSGSGFGLLTTELDSSKPKGLCLFISYLIKM